MTNLPIPKLSDIEAISTDIFRVIDTDCNKKLDVQEFCDWMENNYPLQDFILKYTGS